jgi:hypothetical protein
VSPARWQGSHFLGINVRFAECPVASARPVQHGVPLNTVPNLLDHSTVQMSLRYAHLAPDQRREAVAKLNEKPILALTLRLPWNSFQPGCAYPIELNGGKGGNRTLDPGIMSAVL